MNNIFLVISQRSSRVFQVISWTYKTDRKGESKAEWLDYNEDVSDSRKMKEDETNIKGIWEREKWVPTGNRCRMISPAQRSGWPVWILVQTSSYTWPWTRSIASGSSAYCVHHNAEERARELSVPEGLPEKTHSIRWGFPVLRASKRWLHNCVFVEYQ